MNSAANTVLPNNLPTVGDRFVMQSGAGFAEMIGTVTEDISNEWGPQFAVRYECGMTSAISRYIGTATIDADGFAECGPSVTASPIGCYKVTGA